MFISELLREMSKDTIVPTAPGYSTDKEDQSVLKLDDVRKTRLSFEHLNKLRKLNDVRSIEHDKDIEKVSSMYKPAAADNGGGMGM